MDQSLEREIRRLYAGFHSPGDPRGRSFVPLADAYRRAGDLLRARLLLEEGLRRHPGFASAHVVAMRIARDVSDHAGTLAATRRVLELDPGNAEARQVLAEVGPRPEAEPDPPASDSGDEDGPELPADESWMAGDAGAWRAGTDSGLASVDPVALEAEDQHADAGIYTRTMGQLYERQGLRSQAIAVYERILESEPDDDVVAGRLESLRRRDGGRAAPVRERDAAERADAGAHDHPPVVPIEALAPDAPRARASAEGP